MKKLDFKTILIIVFALVFGVMIVIMTKQSNTIKDHERNINAYQSELVQLRTQNNDLLYVNNSYKLKIDELDEELKISKQDVKDIQKTLDSYISYIAHIESKVIVDTLYIPNTIIQTDSVKEIYWAWRDDWVNIKGKSDWTTTQINKLEVDVPLIVGLTDDYKIFAKSDNPYLHITSIEGAELDRNLFQRKWDWNWTFQAGIGLTYGIVNRQLDLGPTVSWGIELRF